MSCDVGHRRGSDLALLWLWCGPVARAPIRPLAWEPPYAVGVALKRQKKKLIKNFKKRIREEFCTSHFIIILNILFEEGNKSGYFYFTLCQYPPCKYHNIFWKRNSSSFLKFYCAQCDVLRERRKIMCVPAWEEEQLIINYR